MEPPPLTGEEIEAAAAAAASAPLQNASDFFKAVDFMDVGEPSPEPPRPAAAAPAATADLLGGGDMDLFGDPAPAAQAPAPAAAAHIPAAVSNDLLGFDLMG